MRLLGQGLCKSTLMSEIHTTPQLPASGFSDGDRIIDSDGNVWEWNLEQNSWIVRGKADPIPDGSERTDGLVTPEVVRKLKMIQDLMDQGVPFAPFKLKSRVQNPYFYYFQSSDGLIRFAPEGNGLLRMEIDRSRLYSMIVSRCCIGPDGKRGEQGAKGIDGKPAANEVFQNPIVDGSTLVIEAVVPTPIDTPISTRIYDSADEEIADVMIATDGSGEVSVVISNGYSIEITDMEASYDSTSEVLNLRIPFSEFPDGSDIIGWKFKSRQQGAKGEKGEDGKAYLEVVDRLVEDSALESPEAVVSLRHSGTSDLRSLSADMHTDICVSSLSAVEGDIPPSDLLSARLVAAEITTRDCKRIGHFDVKENFSNRLKKAPPLDLPSWTPADGCGQRNRWSAFRFNWWDFTGSDLRYMFNITPTRRPPSKCCEQDFFWCPNIGDEPCGVRGSIDGVAPLLEMPKKFQDQCICDCDDPIEMELQSGGYSFMPIDTTTEDFESGALSSVAVDSVLDGSTDQYYADVIVGSGVSLKLSIEPSPETCGGAAKTRSDCAYKDVKRIHSVAVIEDLSGNAVFNSPQVVEVEEYPGEMEFILDTKTLPNGDEEDTKLESRVRISLRVNSTNIEACQGYRVVIAAVKSLG